MNAPKKPHRPSEPKKPEKSYTIARQYDIDLYDGLKFTQVVEQISKLGICYGDLFFRAESTGSYGGENICLSYSRLETIDLEDAHFDKLMIGYERKMVIYKHKLAQYESLAANYKKDYQVWKKAAKEEQRQKDVKEFERLKKALKL